MSDSSEHLDPKEATEARLCAYLEGELPQEERAEIEQYLVANPQHRRLIADLAQTRQWMRSIPHESAPNDLAESFQQQIERSMLLDDPNGGQSGWSIARWPQYAMIAAIAVLTAGLGVTLVIMLKGPGAGGHNKSIAMGPGEGTPSVATQPALVDQERLAAKAKEPADAVLPPVAAAIPAAPPAPDAAVARPMMVATDEPDRRNAIRGFAQKADHLADTNVEAEAMKTKVMSSGYRLSPDQKTVCFVVSTDNPTVALDQVQMFFTRHQLMLDQPSLLQANSPTVLVAAEDANKQLQANGPSVPGGRQRAGAGQGGAGARGGQGALNNGNTVHGGTLNTTAPAFGQNQLAPNEPAKNTQITGQNANGNGVSDNTAQAVQTQSAGTNNQQFTPAPAANQTGEAVFVAHGLTPLQLALLSDSLATDNPGRSIKQLTLSQGQTAALKDALAPANGTIVKGETLTVTVPQLVGPGVEKTNVVKVADDGTVRLPTLIDAIPAAGATAGELERRITTKLHDDDGIANPSVTITRAPSTQPAAPVTQPLEKAADESARATTQPARENAGIDVVVVIEKAGGGDKR